MYAKEALDNIKSVTVNEYENTLSEATKGNYIAAIIGAGLGFAISYQNKYNLILGSFIGAISAALLSKIFIDKQIK